MLLKKKSETKRVVKELKAIDREELATVAGGRDWGWQGGGWGGGGGDYYSYGGYGGDYGGWW